MRVLLVEDDIRIAGSVTRGLEEEGFAVVSVGDGETGAATAQSQSFHVIVLDIMLPRCDGFSALRRMREAGVDTPVLMLTARGDIRDKVQGFDTGADDYLTKPFAFAELLARIRALARRRKDQPHSLRIADLAIDPLTRKVTRAGQAVELSPREYELLEYFARNADRTLTRVEIAEQVWGYQHEFGTNVIEVYVNYLRRKIDRGRRRKLIRTVRGVGYVFSATEDGDEA